MASLFRRTSSLDFADLVDTSQPSLYIAIASCLFNPVRPGSMTCQLALMTRSSSGTSSHSEVSSSAVPALWDKTEALQSTARTS